MHHQHLGPRAEYRRQESERIKNSMALAETFGHLRSLVVELEYLGQENLTSSTHVKYTVNLTHAKSIFTFDCPNSECVQGDFDLSGPLADAVQSRQSTASGEVVCQGWRSRTTIDKVRCGRVLRYALLVGY